MVLHRGEAVGIILYFEVTIPPLWEVFMEFEDLKATEKV